MTANAHTPAGASELEIGHHEQAFYRSTERMTPDPASFGRRNPDLRRPRKRRCLVAPA